MVVRTLFLTAICTLCAPAILAQTQPGCTSSGGNPGKCTPVPVDGGLGLLALAGGALAASRLRRREDAD